MSRIHSSALGHLRAHERVNGHNGLGALQPVGAERFGRNAMKDAAKLRTTVDANEIDILAVDDIAFELL